MLVIDPSGSGKEALAIVSDRLGKVDIRPLHFLLFHGRYSENTTYTCSPTWYGYGDSTAGTNG